MSEPKVKDKLDAFRPQKRNANRHTQRGMGALETSIQRDGWIGAVTVAADGETFDGSARLEVGAATGFEDAIVIESDGSRPIIHRRVDIATADDPRAVRLGYAANRVAALNLDFDPALILAGLDAGLDLGALWNSAEIDELAKALNGGGGLDIADAPPVYAHADIIEAAFTYFRSTGFPYRRLPIHVCMQEINKLAATEVDSLLNTDTAYHVADTYHPHRFHASADGMKSPYDAFEDDALLRRAMQLAIDNEVPIPDHIWGYLLIVSGTQATANFRPGFASLLYRQYCKPGDTVLDTSTGYGGRLVGFMASGIAGRYIGIDPNAPTHEGNARMALDLGFADKVELHNKPAEDVPHSAVANRCDFAFTSPPYFAKEHYSEDDTQSWIRYKTGDAWRDGFLAPMMALQYAALKAGAYAIVNIADVKVRGKSYPLVDWAREAGKAAGFEYVRTDKFMLTRRFGAGLTDGIVYEPVLVFRKAVSV